MLCSLAAIAFLTLLPATSGGVHESRKLCSFPGDSAAEDALLNILLFAPLGWSLQRAGVRRGKIVLAGFLISATIELLQLGIPGRETCLADAIANTVGTALGALLCSSWGTIAFPSAHRARFLAVGASIFWLIVACGTIWSFEPAPSETSYFSQWAPADVYPATFRGSVLSADIDYISIPAGRLPDSELIRGRFRSDSVDVRIVASLGDSTTALSSIVSILDDRRREILLVGQDRTSLVFRIRMRSSDLRLRNFGIDVPLISVHRGQSISIEATKSSRTQTIRVVGADGARVEYVHLTPRLGWTLVAPFSPILGPASEVIAAMWLVLMLVPTGYWAARSYPAAPRFAIVVTLGAITVPLLLPALALGAATPGVGDWLPSTLGAATGWAAGRLARHFARVACHTAEHGPKNASADSSAAAARGGYHKDR